MRAALAVVLQILACRAPCQMYRVTDLGTLGGSFTQAFGVAAGGRIVGQSATSNGATHAFLYYGGILTDMGALGGGQSVALGVNGSGEAAGFYTQGNSPRSFVYASGGMQHLGTNLGGSADEAFGINAAGQVVGWSNTTNDSAVHGFIWHEGAMTDLGVLPGDQNSKAFAINASGEIVGVSFVHSNFMRAFLRTSGGMIDLGNLGGGYAVAHGINDAGQVVGDSGTGSGLDHAFLYSAGSMSDIGTLGGKTSVATGINNAGQVVGSAGSANKSGIAFIWSNGAMADLNTLTDASGSGYTLVGGAGIDDQGGIACNAIVGSMARAVFLTPYWTDAPTSYSVTAGTYLSGNLASLANADGNYLVVQSGPSFSNGAPPLSVVLTGTSTLASPTDVRMQLTGHTDSVDLAETVEFYDYVAGAWVLVDSTTATTSDSSLSAISTDPARFVQAGTNQMKARISLKPSGPISKSPWSLYLDQAVWNASP